MPKRIFLLWPLLGACLLLFAGYWVLRPTASALAAPLAMTGPVDHLVNPAALTGATCTSAADCSLHSAHGATLPVAVARKILASQDSLARFSTLAKPATFEGRSATLPSSPAITSLAAGNSSPTKLGTATFFTATVTDGPADSYAWDFGDGNIGSGITTTHSYTESGVYTATVVASNVTDTLTATTTVYVGDAVVEVGNNFYSPAEVTIAPGDKVVWVLRAGVHSVTANDGSFEQPAGNSWTPFIHTFVAPGTVTYHCSVHGFGMSGRVIVSEPPDDLHLHLPNIIRQADEG